MSDRTTDLEDELDAIRLALHEETRDMTPEEKAAFIRADTEPLIRQYHMKIADLKPLTPKRRAARVAV